MTFNALRTREPRQVNKCGFCNDAPKDGSIMVAVRDKEGKGVTSRMVSGCEKCIESRYPELIDALVKPTPNGAQAKTTKAGDK